MPQMNPMNWILILSMVTFSLTLLSSMIFFMTNPSSNLTLPRHIYFNNSVSKIMKW